MTRKQKSTNYENGKQEHVPIKRKKKKKLNIFDRPILDGGAEATAFIPRPVPNTTKRNITALPGIRMGNRTEINKFVVQLGVIIRCYFFGKGERMTQMQQLQNKFSNIRGIINTSVGFTIKLEPQ
eukprot:TRINITY_DN3164_c0_g1_i11.p1 TRINITY_DN3164_c0_g1~~TRINITY_DN3164_c0_g1_i11.p1  ORF type:complete len:125 (+),score=23.31 TRINITY_DN3164_c0_g1_i11:321-695(+)